MIRIMNSRTNRTVASFFFPFPLSIFIKLLNRRDDYSQTFKSTFPLTCVRVRFALWRRWFSYDNETDRSEICSGCSQAGAQLRYLSIFNLQICTAFVHSLCIKTLSATMDLVGSLTQPPPPPSAVARQPSLWHGRKHRDFQTIQNAACQPDTSTWFPAAPLRTTCLL